MAAQERSLSVVGYKPDMVVRNVVSAVVSCCLIEHDRTSLATAASSQVTCQSCMQSWHAEGWGLWAGSALSPHPESYQIPQK